MVSDVEPESDLRDYLAVLRRRKWVVALSILFSLGAAVFYTWTQTPLYAARAKVLVEPSGPSVLSGSGADSKSFRTVETEIEVLRSAPVQAAVQEKLGYAPGISAAIVGESNVMEVRAEGEDPKVAADVANGYANAYIEYGRKQAVDNLLAATREIQARVSELQGQIDALDRQVNDAPPLAKEGVRQTIEDQKRVLVEQQGAYKDRIAQAQVDAALVTSQAQLVSSAVPPKGPVKPRPLRNAVLGGVLGLIIGVALAFAVDHLDDSVKFKDDLDRAAQGVPAIGVIPAMSSWKAKDRPKVVTVSDPRSPPAEAFRTLRTSLQFVMLGTEVRILQVTSPSVAEGKTTIVANLGVALASMGQRVVMVDCDLRKPRLHHFFDVDNSLGITSVLLGDAPLTAALQAVPGQPGLSLLASGPIPPNPAEMLSSSRATEALAAVQAHADIVVVDSPPILPVTDALILSGKADGVLLACRARVTKRKDLARAVELLGQVDAPLLGTIFNGVTAGGGYSGSYYHYQYYQQELPKGVRKLGGFARGGKSRGESESDVEATR